MRKLCFLAIVAVALIVAGSSTAFAAAEDVATGSSAIQAPYWQAGSNSIYTFIAATNPSIAGNISRQITVTAISQEGNAAATFTIDVSSTARVFINNTNHSTVNSNTVSGANWISLTGSGNVIIKGVAYDGAGAPGGATLIGGNQTAFLDVISVWGAIVVPGGTGFAMEFIGDLQKSTDAVGIGFGL